MSNTTYKHNRLLQANVNHSARAQDLLIQTLAEGDYALAIVAEPYWVPLEHPHWTASGNGTVAITWRRAANPLPCTPYDKGETYVAIRWGDVVIVGVYISPSARRSKFEEILESIGECVTRAEGRPVLVGGDFNAHSDVWGVPEVGSQGKDPGRLVRGTGAGMPK